MNPIPTPADNTNAGSNGKPVNDDDRHAFFRRAGSDPELAGFDTLGGSIRSMSGRRRRPSREILTDKSEKIELPRLVVRNLPFHQSKNTVRVTHNMGWGIFFLLKHDWFHAFLRQPTSVSMATCLAIWTLMILVFAACYVAVDRHNPNPKCGLGFGGTSISWHSAWAFSLETCTTVGYGLPSGSNAFFEHCPGLQVISYLQMVWSMMFNAFLFAFFYNRLGRSEARSAQVVFSEKALVTVEDNQVRFQIRLFDVDAKHPVVEPHVRLYVVTKGRPVPRPLRLLQPNDETGAMLFMSLPTVVSHHIDIYSMLHPPVPHPLDNSGLVLRQADSITGNREEIICPICGESYGTHERWASHARYQRIIETKENYPVEGTHLSLTEESLQPPPYPIMNVHKLKEHFQAELSEVIAIVEGIDPLMSGTFQALQSYKIEDIIWNDQVKFMPSLHISGDHLEIDLDLFHKMDNVPVSIRSLAEWRADNNSSHGTANPPRRKRIKNFSYRVHDGLAFKNT